MKTIRCIKCKTPYEVPDNFGTYLRCEDCDPFMNPPKKTYPHAITWFLSGMSFGCIIMSIIYYLLSK